MLKLGCMSLSYKDEFSANKLDLEQFIERAYQLGLDGLDVHTRAFASLDPAYLRGIRMQAFRRGLALSYIGVSSNFGKPQDELAAEVATAKEWIDVAAFMGIPLVRVFAAWIPEGDREEDVWARMMPCLAEVAAHGEEKGVVVGLHNHNHGCVTRTGKDVRRIIEGVPITPISRTSSTRVSTSARPGPRASAGTRIPPSTFTAALRKPLRWPVHVRCKIYRIQSGVEEWLNYPRIFEILQKVNYNGWLSVVYEGQDVEAEATAVPKAVRYLRGLMAEYDAA